MTMHKGILIKKLAQTPGWLRNSLLVFSVVGVSGCDVSETQAPPYKASDEVVEATIADIQTAIRSGQTSCRDVVEAYSARIDAYDQSTKLNSVVLTNPRALERADEIDAALAAGKDVGPLFCAPLLVKDNFDTHDMPTSAGSITLKDSYPPDDAFMVRKLREAGAIILAKTNLAEWAFSARYTVSSAYGTTANAYALDRVPAGSSGGTASSVAASFGVAGMGSDTGNSIRGPSSHLALFGIRSTLGLTSRDGVVPLSLDRDIAGPMTRTVEDGARLFNVVAGYDPADRMTELGKGKREADYTSFLDKEALKGARIGVLRALVDTDNADPKVIAVFNKAVEELRQAGAVIVDTVAIPNFADHRKARNYCRQFRYDMGLYLKSLGDKAPMKDVMEAFESGQYAPESAQNMERYMQYPFDVAPENWEEPCPFYPEHPGRQAYLADVVVAMDAADVQALIYPSWTNPPAHLDRANEEYRGDNSQIVAPLTGLPAVTVPMGYSYGNLPAGLQILGRPYAEGTLIGLAYAYEQATQHRQAPKAFPPLN